MSDGRGMKLSVIVPVFNEEKTVTAILDLLVSVNVGADLEIIIVDDGSTDATAERIRAWAGGRQNVVTAFHGANRGKGAAVRTGIGLVTGDVAVVQDADLEYDPADFKAMLEPIRAGRADVVYGSRVLSKAPYAHLRYYLGGRLLSAVTNLLFRTQITDEPTCYKMFRAGVLRSMDLVSDGFEFCPEITARTALAGIPIHEVPIRYHPRSIGEGKKIRWHDGLKALWVLVRYRFFGPPGPR